MVPNTVPIVLQNIFPDSTRLFDVVFTSEDVFLRVFAAIWVPLCYAEERNTYRFVCNNLRVSK